MKTKLFFLINIFSITVFSQLNYLTSTQGGSSYEVCYYNNHVYSGSANTLEIFDLTGPNQKPGNLKFKKRFLSNIDNIQVRNGYLYICANHDGLWKFNINADPESPIFVAHYSPASLGASIYDIAFCGDSILVAAKTKVILLSDSNNTLTYKKTIASYTGAARVRGVDIKDSLLAYTVGFSASNTQDGVYLYNLKNNKQLYFYNDTQADPLEVYFGQNNKLLHVMGGSMASFPFVNGLYYALNYTNTSSLQLQFKDTINGFLLLGSISAPMSAKLINDTIYIATQGGGPINYSSGPFSGQVYVYDATNMSNIKLLTDIYAGLYHFDIDINEATRKMYVASEWYGVLTVDVKDIYNEVSNGNKMTGGWCHGSAVAKNRLVEASEGYGMRLFDISAIQSPQLIAEDTTVGFSRAISISDSADYVYGWFLTGKRLRVRSGNDLSFVKDTTVDQGTLIISDFEKSRYRNGKVAVIENISPGNKKIVVADVNNPLNAHVTYTRQKNNVEDILFHPNGNLFVCADDSIIIFNPNTMVKIVAVTPPAGGLQQYKAFTLSNDTIYVYYSGLGEGIAKYYYNSSLQTLTYVTAGVYNMNSTYRIFMATNDTVIYIASSIDSLKAISRATTPKVIATYNHGADFVYDNVWGVTDLYYKKGHLFLNEYMGQTSIFGQPTITGIKNYSYTETLAVYPNPASDIITINTGTKNESRVTIYSVDGKLVYITDVRGERIQLSTSGFDTGVYFVNVMCEGINRSDRVLIEK